LFNWAFTSVCTTPSTDHGMLVYGGWCFYADRHSGNKYNKIELVLVHQYSEYWRWWGNHAGGHRPRGGYSFLVYQYEWSGSWPVVLTWSHNSRVRVPPVG